MKFVALGCLLLCAFVLGGCAPRITPAGASPTLSTLPVRSGTIRVGFSTSADFGDVPSLMAHELLTARGYTVEVTTFTGADVETAALLQGELDIANGSMRTIWLGLAKRANALTIMEQVADVWLLVAKSEIMKC